MRSASGTLRLDLAQYREMKVFTQFSNYLDDETQKNLRSGETLMNVLKQEQYRPYQEWEQAVILAAATAKALDGLDENGFADSLHKLCEGFSKVRGDVVERIKSGAKLSDEDRTAIAEYAKAAEYA